MDPKAVLSSSSRTALPDSAFACPEKRLYPHHHADGSLDVAHLKAALSRVGDASNDQCGRAHLEAHARAEGIGDRGKAGELDDEGPLELSNEEIDAELDELPDEEVDEWDEAADGKAGPPKFVFGRPNPNWRGGPSGAAYRTNANRDTVEAELAAIEARARARGLRPTRAAILATYRRNLERRVRAGIRSRSTRKFGRTPRESAVSATMRRALDRNPALSRLYAGQLPAKALLPIKAAPLEADEEAAWFAGRIPRRLLAIPFGGPIPSPVHPRGVDLDGETFSERTDIYGGHRALRQTRERIVDFHHRKDPTGVMATAALGKAILDEEPDDDGWWVDFWFKAGERRVGLIQKLAARGAQLFGSSEPVVQDVKKAADGEILVWPFLFETVSTSPQNTYSVFRPAKAVLEEAEIAGIAVAEGLMDLATDLDALVSDLRRSSLAGDDAAKAGRDLDRADQEEIAGALERLGAGYDRALELATRIRT